MVPTCLCLCTQAGTAVPPWQRGRFHTAFGKAEGSDLFSDSSVPRPGASVLVFGDGDQAVCHIQPGFPPAGARLHGRDGAAGNFLSAKAVPPERQPVRRVEVADLTQLWLPPSVPCWQPSRRFRKLALSDVVPRPCGLATEGPSVGQLAAGTCEIVTLDRDSSQPRRTIARQTARCACRKGQIAGTTRARPACVDGKHRGPGTPRVLSTESLRGRLP
ncbi:Chemokine-like protein TAFA-5 [Plecturocebus cupreus]